MLFLTGAIVGSTISIIVMCLMIVVQKNDKNGE